MKNKPSFILISAAIILAASCNPVSTAPRPDATATVAMTVKPYPSATATLPRIVAPAVSSAPTEAITQPRTVAPSAKATPTDVISRLWTAVPITQTEPSIGKDKTSMNGVPIPLPFDPVIENLVSQAKQDLAKQLGTKVDQIDLVDAQSVTWPDGSLGCPQPGMLYTQVQVEGLLIRFRASGQIYEYHSGGSRAPFLCKPTS